VIDVAEKKDDEDTTMGLFFLEKKTQRKDGPSVV